MDLVTITAIIVILIGCVVSIRIRTSLLGKHIDIKVIKERKQIEKKTIT